MSPNRQKSFAEFQEFASTEHHKILKPCQTRWLSLHQCCRRILEQWPALLLFFTTEVFDKERSAGGDRILQALKTPYIKVTVEFCDFVLGDLCAANLMLQSNSFQLHNLVPECERIIKMFSANFRKPVKDVKKLDIDDESQWVPLENVYPGLSASDSVKDMMPHEKESFLRRCRDWYREAIRQILMRIDFGNPLYAALQDLEPKRIISGEARVDSGAQIAKLCPRIVTNQKGDLQVLGREWRSLLVDDNIKPAVVSHSVEEFWKTVSGIPAYCNIAGFILAVLSLYPKVQQKLRELSVN